MEWIGEKRGPLARSTRLALVLAAILGCLSQVCCRRQDSKPDTKHVKALIRSGQFAAALAETEAGIRNTNNTSPEYWTFYLQKVDILDRRDGVKATRSLLDPEPPSGPQFATQRARRKVLQGWIERDAGNVPAAEQRWNEGLAIARSANDHEQAAGLDFSLAQMLSQQNRFVEAGEFLRDGNRHADAFHDRYLTNYGLNTQAIWLIEQARFEEALPLLDRVYAMADAGGDVAFGALSNKGWCLYRLGEFDQSLAVLQQMVDASSHEGTAKIPSEVYGHIGNIYDQREDFTDAGRYYLKSLKLAEERGETVWSVKWLGDLAHLSIQTKDWTAADSYNRQALALARKMPDRTAVLHSLCDSAEILNGRGDFTGAIKQYQEVSRTDTDNRVPALLAHAGLARLYSEHGQDALADREFEAALNIVEDRQLSLAEDEFKVSFLSVLIQVHQSYIDFLMSHGKNERALEIAEASRARILRGRLGNNEKAQFVSAAAYQRLARDSGLVLLSYSLGRERSYVWVTTGSGIVSYPLPPQEKIRSLVEKYRAFVEAMYDPLDTDDTSGPELYQAVLAPALERIPAGSRIVIAPDQALHALNFETLPIPTPRKHYFLEDATITITPSLNLLLGRPPGPTHASRLLLIGDPNSSDEHFPKLQYAAKEISLVEGHFSPADVTSYREAQAVPAVYEKSPLDSFSYIHFTAHAIANRMVPLDSAIILSGDNESNKLTAREVLKHPINARLVTISACHGAGAKTYGGEGLVGFMWAFFQSGARNIIAGLWDVSDDSTAQLMDTLYGGIVQGKSPADALRNAKLVLIQANPTWSRPYHWAPFQLYSRELPPPPVTLKPWRSPSPSSDKNSASPN